jgi:hypothetical protein
MQPIPIYEIVREEKRQRAARYREQAAELQTIASGEASATDRDRLLEMVVQYEGLAQRLEEDLGCVPA